MAEEYTPLASKDDVVEALGRALTSEEDERVGAILAKASELFRLASGQQFTPGRSQQRLKVDGGEVRLTQRPVTAVHSVVDARGNAVPFSRFKSTLTVNRGAHELVIVDYSHGDNTVPDLVVRTIADVAKSVLTISKDAAAGLVSMTKVRGPFTRQETYAQWTVGGKTMLSPDDLAIARSFRVSKGSTLVAPGR